VVDLTGITSATNDGPETEELLERQVAVPVASEPSNRNLAERGLWTMVGVGLLWWSWQLIGDSYNPWTVIFLVGANLWGLGTVVAAWLPDNGWTTNAKLTNRLAWATAFVTIATFSAWAIVSLINGLDYGTDAIAFNQYAAQLAIHGVNPYTHSMAPAFQMFHTPTSYYTYSFTGTPVTALSYPSLSFLVYAPFLALGWADNVAPWLNMVAWALTVVMMFAVLPKRVRPVALLLGGYGLYVAFAMGGVTDALFMPLLTVAAYKWDRFGQGRWTYIAPVMFGIAMSIKQTPWPALPFLLLALTLDEYNRTGIEQGIRRAAKYLAVAVVTFLIPNIPWIVASPSAWVKGVFTPLFANMVPTGQGTMSLSLYLHLGGGSMTAFTLAMGFAIILMLIAYVGTYPLLRVALFVLPAFAFFFASRSNVNYFISLIPAGIVAAVTAGPAPLRRADASSNGLRMDGRRFAALGGWGSLVNRLGGPGRTFRSPRWLYATAIAAVVFVAAAAYSMYKQPPFKVQVVGASTTGTTNHIEALNLRVTNTSGKPIQPHFDIMQGGFNSTFWIINSGPKHLAPHGVGKYTIISPNAGAQPGAYGGFNVVGYLSNPESFSVAATYRPHLYSLGFYPQSINAPIPVGRKLTVHVQIYNRNGSQANRKGVMVRLGQLVWYKTGPRGAHAQINDSRVGKFALAATNSHGSATFTIVGKRAQTYPVTFSATLLNETSGAVYGNSGDLNIRFVGR
jgi:uncharacterized membrane protein